MSYGTTQRYRIENRLCLTCASQLSLETKILFCPGCATTKRKQQTTIVSTRRKLGLCTSCGLADSVTGDKCESCMSKFAGYQKKIRNKRLANGMCSDCGKRSPLETMLKNDQYRLCEICYLQKISRSQLGSRKHWITLQQKLIEQEYRCPYTGELLVLAVNDSVDHIYPKARYPELALDPTNIEWVTREANEMKRNRTPDEFVAFMRHIIKYREGK